MRWWTLAEIRELRRLVEQDDLSAARAAVALGRTRKSVYSAARRYKIWLRGEIGRPRTVLTPLTSTERSRNWRKRSKPR